MKILGVCVKNDDYEVSLERRKIYELIPDAGAERQGQVRVIDVSEEDYLYPAKYFVPFGPAQSDSRCRCRSGIIAR